MTIGIGAFSPGVGIGAYTGAVLDVTPPVFTAGLTPSAINTGGLTVGFTANEDCTVYVIAVAQGSTIPTPAEIKAGVSYGAVTALAASNKAVTGGQADTIALSGIVGFAGQQVTVYATAEDDSGNLQEASAVRSVTVTLQAVNNPPTVSGDYPQQVAVVGQPFTYNGAANISDTDALTYTISGVANSAINSATGQVNYNFAAGDLGLNNLVITATDTAGQSVSATLPVNVIEAATGFWDYTPPSYRIIDMYKGSATTQDKDATLNYWLDFSNVVGGRLISSAVIDPDSLLEDVSATLVGINAVELTDNNGEVLSTGKVLGLQISGGIAGEPYEILSRITLDSSESDDRTLLVRIVDK